MTHKVSEGDKRAWQHAIDSGRFAMLDEKDITDLVTILCYTRQVVDKRKTGTSTKDIIALLNWASSVRLEAGLLDNVLTGHSYVRMKGKTPEFSLSPKGEALAKDMARQMGLPVEDDK